MIASAGCLLEEAQSSRDRASGRRESLEGRDKRDIGLTYSQTAEM